MPKKYREYHKEKAELERKEQLASAHTVVQLIKVCAEDSTNFQEFTDLLKNVLTKLEQKMDE